MEMKATHTTKRTNPFIPILIQAILAASVGAQTWETVDDYQYVENQPTSAGAVLSAFGAVWVAGATQEPNYVTRGILSCSTNLGADWITTNTFELSNYKTLAADSSRLYVGGNSLPKWYVRASSDQGATWSTIHEYPGPGQGASLYQIAADGNGNLYAVGSLRIPSGNSVDYHWIVMRGTPSLNAQNQEVWTWATIDDYRYGQSGNYATAIAVRGTNVYVAGYGASSDGKDKGNSHWLVRKWSGSGTNWVLLDDYTPYAGGQALPLGIGLDSAMNVYVVGQSVRKMRGAQLIRDWVVRKRAYAGTTWTNAEVLQSAAGSTMHSGAYAVTFDAQDIPYVVGRWGGDDNQAWWLVRRQISPSFNSNWMQSDKFRYPDGVGSFVEDCTVDVLGNVYAAGSAHDGTNSHWIVRRLLAPTQP